MPERARPSKRLDAETPVTVRICRADEVEVIAATEPPGREYARRTYQRQTEGRCLYLVAWAGTVPVGSGELEWSTPPELMNLHVRADSRGLGIGSKLVAAAEEACRGHRAIRIGVADDNPAAARLYERLGYVRTGETVTDSYAYVDDAGVRHHATEVSAYLVKDLSATVPPVGV